MLEICRRFAFKIKNLILVLLKYGSWISETSAQEKYGVKLTLPVLKRNYVI